MFKNFSNIRRKGECKMTTKELQEILDKHKKWLNYEDGGERADLSDADLSGADLSGADLRGADLRSADLSGADLIDADLSGADLSGADLSDADLSGADLRSAYLIRADLRGAGLRSADLSGAYLIRAYLRGADLRSAYLIGADLRGAYLSGAYLSGADLRGAENVPFVPYSCPDTGSFIGYKKANGYIVELEILSDARRCSATGRKCRCDKAKVLSIQNMDGSIADITEVASNYDSSFMYRVGEIVEELNFNEDRWNECSEGIHFFINRQEAVEY